MNSLRVRHEINGQLLFQEIFACGGTARCDIVCSSVGDIVKLRVSEIPELDVPEMGSVFDSVSD